MAQIEPLVQRGQHIERLLAIWESAVRKTHVFLSEEDIASIRPEVSQGIAGIEHFYCFVDDGGVIQGFIGVENHKIEMLFVDAEARGQGVGKQLLNTAVMDLDARYVDVNEQNEQGVGFYDHMGFAVMDRDECDDQGRPFPILHLEMNREA